MTSATATTEPIVSHGRGGAGNINPDETPYADGEVTRIGAEGSHNDGAFSTGRGGAANIGDAGKAPAPAGRADKENVPESAIRPSSEGDFHVGRGGAGNEHVAEKKPGSGDDHPRGLADKLKDKLMGVFKK